jgi:dTMP kinase
MSAPNDLALAPAPAAARGAFIVLEGMDRSGKTTQVKLLESRLVEAGRRVHLMRFPGEFGNSHARFGRFYG